MSIFETQFASIGIILPRRKPGEPDEGPNDEQARQNRERIAQLRREEEERKKRRRKGGDGQSTSHSSMQQGTLVPRPRKPGGPRFRIRG